MFLVRQLVWLALGSLLSLVSIDPAYPTAAVSIPTAAIITERLEVITAIGVSLPAKASAPKKRC